MLMLRLLIASVQLGQPSLHSAQRASCWPWKENINGHVEEEGSFWQACRCDHVDVVRRLLVLQGDLRIDVQVGDDWGLRIPCSSGSIAVVHESCELCGAPAG